MKFSEILRKRRKELGLTQQDIADLWGISPVNVSGWEWNKTMPEAAKLPTLAKRLGMSVSELMGEGIPSFSVDGRTGELAPAPSVYTLHPDDPQPSDIVYVPESRIEFSAGNGRAPVYELIEAEEPAAYRLSWFQKHRINPDRVRRFRVSGDSMEPFLFANDTILVNLDETTIVEGKLYAIRYADELRVKFLSRRLDGTLVLRSVNPLYKDEEVPPALAEEHISIIGRVRDKAGRGGL
jgi:phage repressor protein C with HTH and peptisase S24 domain/DNA-binding XRE family transcriptional regulator